MNKLIYYKQVLDIGICPNNIAIIKVADDKIIFVNSNGRERGIITKNREEAETILRTFFKRGSGHDRMIMLDID